MTKSHNKKLLCTLCMAKYDMICIITEVSRHLFCRKIHIMLYSNNRDKILLLSQKYLQETLMQKA